MDKIIDMLMKNLNNAYAPYSQFKVSALLELKDGRLIKGVNVENAAYGLSNCAERSALFSAYSMGVKKSDILRIYLYTDHDYFVTPCGACRQVIFELMEKNAEVILVNNQRKTFKYLNHELLPNGFSGENL